MILVIGSPRSGTGYTAKGLRLGHEREGLKGMASWCMAAKGEKGFYLPPWHGEAADQAGRLIVHQVRHPLKVIASLATLRANTFSWAEDYVDVDPMAPALVKHLQFWVGWVKLCERVSHVTWRVEDQTYRTVDKKTNSRPHGPVTWQELYDADSILQLMVVQRAKDWGYSVAD